MIKFCVYKFLNIKSETIYVGKTKDIYKRIKQHFSNHGNLPYDCYIKTEKVVYAECSNADEMDIKEKYLINILNPYYNKQCKNHNEFDFVFSFNWHDVFFDKAKYIELMNENNYQIETMKFNNFELCFPNIQIKCCDILIWGAKLKFLKNEDTYSYNIFSIKDSKISATKINGQLFFICYQITSILNPQASETSQGIYHLIKKGYIKEEDIIILQDKIFIEKNIDSYIISEYGSYVYPKHIPLITLNGVLNLLNYYNSLDTKESALTKDKRESFSQ